MDIARPSIGKKANRAVGRKAFIGASLLLASNMTGCRRVPENRAVPCLPVVAIEPERDHDPGMREMESGDRENKEKEPELTYDPGNTTCKSYVAMGPRGDLLRFRLKTYLDINSKMLRKRLGAIRGPVNVLVSVDINSFGVASVSDTLTLCGRRPCALWADVIKIARLNHAVFPLNPFPYARDCTIGYPFSLPQ